MTAAYVAGLLAAIAYATGMAARANTARRRADRWRNECRDADRRGLATARELLAETARADDLARGQDYLLTLLHTGDAEQARRAARDGDLIRHAEREMRDTDA